MDPNDSIRYVIACIIFFIEGFFLYQLFSKSTKYSVLIKDHSIQPPESRPYSFARVQLFFWTIIIAICFTLVYAVNGLYQDILNKSTLTLLGISLATTTVGRAIDNREETTGLNRHQDHKTEGFWIDILSDENGVSIHRFQALLFNIFYGLVYLSSFLNSDMFSLPVFGDFELGLIGLSSGGYLILKVRENKSSNKITDEGDRFPIEEKVNEQMEQV